MFGAKYERPRLFLAGDHSIQDGHDGRNVGAQADTVSVAFDAKGVEASGYYDLSRRFRISGFKRLDPEPVAPLASDFRIRNYIIGGAFYFNSQSLIYAEWRIEDSVDQYGEEVPNVLAAGLRLDFGLLEMQRNDAPPLRFPESTESRE